MAIPVAGFLVGLVTLMLATHHEARPRTIVPKLAGATVVVLVGLVASVPLTVIVAATTMVVMVALMILDGTGVPGQPGRTLS